jgi:CubicO group peptidase (beta-lactamase class C family)
MPDAVDALAERILATGVTPGLSLAVTDRDGGLDVRCYGLANPASGRPVTPDTLFEIGSITKSFTAVCLMRRVESGELDLEAEVRSLVPLFPVPGVTVHQLLTHTAGLPMGLDEDPSTPMSVLRLAQTTVVPPGRFWYSNPGYQGLGMVLEGLTGEPYQETFRREILEPLGMTSSEPDIRNEVRPRLAVGHSQADDERPWHPGDPLVPATWLEYQAADGSVCCTPADLAAYARMLLVGGDGVLSERGHRLMTTSYVDCGDGTDYGYALDVRRADGWIGHSGGMVGYHAQMWIDPAAGRAAVGFSNGLRGQRHLVERALGADEPDLADLADTAHPETFDAEPPAEWRARRGIYRSHNPWMPCLEVGTRDGKPLLVQDGEELALTPAEDGAYRIGEEAWSPERLRFDTEVDGVAMRALLNTSPYARMSLPA